MDPTEKVSESKEPAWMNSAFVVFENFELEASSQGEQIEGNVCASRANNYWIRVRTSKENCDVLAYLLLSGFGEGTTVVKYVAEKLVESLTGSPELAKILSMLRERKPKQSKDIDNMVESLIKGVFLRVDNECYEAALTPILETHDAEDSFSSPLFLTSGCSAILALILDNRLYMANCGNSVGLLGKEIGEQLAVFKVSESHEQGSNAEDCPEVPEFVAYLYKTPTSCFGDYGRKTEAQLMDNESEVAPAASSEPFVAGNIELNHTVRFVMLLPPLTSKILEKLYPEKHEADEMLVSLITEALKDDSRSPKSAIQEVLKGLNQRFWDEYSTLFMGRPKPELCLAYVDLENEFQVDSINGKSSGEESPSTSVEKPLNDQDSNHHPLAFSSARPGSSGGPSKNTVKSEVDWSEFNHHELRDTVLAKIESLKQLYNKDRGQLTSIAEQ